MATKVEIIKLSRIYLDNENPRHDPIANEKEIISHLIATEDVKPLARHIAEVGGTSPLELIAVVPHSKAKDAYIPAEGNRRICALKLLADPDKADTEANKKYFRILKDRMAEPLVAVNAVVFPDKVKARPWVSLRHEGLQGGVGTKPWNAQQKTRFNMQGDSPRNPNAQASLLLDYARTHGLLNADKLDQISITTLTRYLSNPVFRDMLGLTDNRTITITVPAEEFHTAVTRFLADSLDASSGVNSRTSVAERRDYAHRLRNEGVAPSTRGQAAVDLSDRKAAATSAQAAKSTSTSSTRRNNRSRDQDDFVVPRDFKAKIKNPILKRLFDELRLLPAEQFSFSAAYLLRGVIEQAASLYLKQKQKGVVPPKDLHLKLSAMAELLEKDGMSARELKSLRTMASVKDSRYSADTLGAFVHGGAIPTRVDSIKAWDGIQAVMDRVFSELK